MEFKGSVKFGVQMQYKWRVHWSTNAAQLRATNDLQFGVQRQYNLKYKCSTIWSMKELQFGVQRQYNLEYTCSTIWSIKEVQFGVQMKYKWSVIWSTNEAQFVVFSYIKLNSHVNIRFKSHQIWHFVQVMLRYFNILFQIKNVIYVDKLFQIFLIKDEDHPAELHIQTYNNK
jgi:hypothetical protein